MVIYFDLMMCRSVHSSAYDKNPEEQVNSTVVSDDLNPPKPEQYWAPDPKTGVFGPASDQNSAGKYGFQASASEESVLEQKTFFRPLEDLDKPDHAWVSDWSTLNKCSAFELLYLVI